ncbi:hypothetical protein [Halomicrobium katesii]|uniref:hypothetical protein n=1 Tax=Halomicrobium katesii TaxID=437163 RepID=UPI00036BBAC2|nr:hypothetical protein [Halomicrobium katesii]
MIYATRGLVESLLGMGRDADPDSVTVAVSVTPAGDLPEADLDPTTDVFTHFYMPSAGNSVSAVFGFDLGTPVAQSNGRFVSHPEGRLGVTKTDDLHEVIFVAVPPWDEESIAAFDRRGEELPLTVLDVAPPEEALE